MDSGTILPQDVVLTPMHCPFAFKLSTSVPGLHWQFQFIYVRRAYYRILPRSVYEPAVPMTEDRRKLAGLCSPSALSSRTRQSWPCITWPLSPSATVTSTLSQDTSTSAVVSLTEVLNTPIYYSYSRGALLSNNGDFVYRNDNHLEILFKFLHDLVQKYCIHKLSKVTVQGGERRN